MRAGGDQFLLKLCLCFAQIKTLYTMVHMKTNSHDLPTLLAIETSTAVCAVAAMADGEICEDTRYLERLHNQQVLAMVDGITTQVRGRLGAAFSGYSVLAFGQGPGSFTGVRISAALVQAVAFAHDAQVLSLPSLQVLAHSALPRGGAAGAHTAKSSPTGEVCGVFVRSRQQAYYVQAFASADPSGGWQPLADAELLDSAAALGQWQARLGIGKQVAWVGERPAWLSPAAAQAPLQPQQITAAGLLATCRQLYQSVALGAVQSALPQYLSADSPWQTTAQRQQRSESRDQ